jgi:hypothetical protein
MADFDRSDEFDREIVDRPPVTAPTPTTPTPATPAERSVLDERAAEDRDEAWGDRSGSGGRDDDWYQRERPPHHE